MIAEIKPKEPYVISTTRYTRQNLEIVLEINNETHELDFMVFYDEENNNSAERKFLQYDVNFQGKKEVWTDEHADYTEELSDELHEFLSNTWGDGRYSDSDYEELFNKIWEFLTDESLVD